MAIRGLAGPQPPLGVPFVLNRASPQATGLIAWYPTVGATGPALLPDRSNRTGPGTASSVPGVGASAVFGSAPLYDGVDDYHDLGLPAALQFANTDPFTVSCWVQPSTGASSGIITGFRNNGTTSGYYIFYGIIAANGVFCDYTQAGTTARINSPALSVPVNVATHIVFTRDASNTVGGMTVYVNGVDRTTRSGAAAPASIVYSGTTFRIGQGVGFPFPGMVADVRYYNRCLSAAEAFALYAPQTRFHLYGVPVARRGGSQVIIPWPILTSGQVAA